MQDETGDPLAAVLSRLGLVADSDLATAIAGASGLTIAEPSEFPAAPVCADRLSPRFLRDARALPLADSADGVEVAFVNPLDPFALSALACALGAPVRARVGRANELEAALDRLYEVADAPDTGDGEAEEADLDRLRDMASDAPVVRAVNTLIARAAEMRASDIHIEPTEDALKVRFRVDGALVEQDALPAHYRSALVSRIKVMAGLNIAERRLPQDGRIRQSVRGQDIDLRIATAPTIHGESVVMRLLDRSNLSLDFGSLGFDGAVLERFTRTLALPHGIVLVTGPTGSGKTTTLYAALASLNAPDRKILTIEDPIEYRLAGINQTQVAPQIGLTFAAALRSFLRQDPDIMMVGEIRDLETAQVAVQASLTGHAILSTLHTNSAAAAVTRLMDMGVEPYLIASTLNGVLAQRLVRRLCPHCRVPTLVNDATLRALGLDSRPASGLLYEAVGCDQCGHSGFRGRAAILEFLEIDDEIRRLIVERAEAGDIQRAALAGSMRSMMSDGVHKAGEGVTTLDEILRVTREA
ncbi:MAG: type II secretion system ATPase GspE [Caulobacter sp.]|nr:type II secretion system ATPase GspE [Caulobacter sp.]